MKTQIIRRVDHPNGSAKQTVVWLGDDEKIADIQADPTSSDHILLVIEKIPMDKTDEDSTITHMTTTHHLNETPLERELRFIDRHIERLEAAKQKYEYLENELLDWVCEDRRREIHNEQTDLEIELVLLEACYDRKVKLEAM